MITAAILRQVMPLSAGLAEVFARPLTTACQRFGIVEPRHLASFLAQVAHESSELRVLEEGLNYRSADRICKVFGKKRFPTLASAAPYVGNPKALASRVYAGRLGNGDEASGDGWKYRARGLIGITFHDNYLLCGLALDLPLLEDPDQLKLTENAAASAAWFWWNRNLNPLASDTDIRDETRAVNGGSNGLEDRERYYARFRQALGC